MNTLALLTSALKRLEQNAHLVKKGAPRDEVLVAIAEIKAAIRDLEILKARGGSSQPL